MKYGIKRTAKSRSVETPTERLKRERAKAAREKNELHLARDLRVVLTPHGIHFETQHQFCALRDWRLDFAQVQRKIAIEVEGGIWSGGRHVRGQGFSDDCEKYNHATILGWHLLRFTPAMVKSGEAVRMVEELIRHIDANDGDTR